MIRLLLLFFLAAPSLFATAQVWYGTDIYVTNIHGIDANGDPTGYVHIDCIILPGGDTICGGIDSISLSGNTLCLYRDSAAPLCVTLTGLSDTPTLAQVLAKGNTANRGAHIDTLFLAGNFIVGNVPEASIEIWDNDQTGMISFSPQDGHIDIKAPGSANGNIVATNFTAPRTWSFPDLSGTIALTPGALADTAVLFAGDGGVIKTDLEGFSYRRNSRSLSVGGDPYDEQAPFGIDLHTFEVINDSGEGSRGLANFTSYTNNATSHFRAARGSVLYPKALQAGDAIMSTGYRGFDGTRFPGSHAAFQVFARENFSLTGGGCYMEFAVSPNGVGDSRKQKLFIYNEKIEHVNENDSQTRGTIDYQIRNSALGSRIIGAKARGTYANRLIIQSGDTLSTHGGEGYDGTRFIRAGGVHLISTGTIGTNRVPSEMHFMTATNAAPSVPTLAMVINSSQNVRVPGFFGTGPTTPTKGIQVSGTSVDQNTVAITPVGGTRSGFFLVSNGGGTGYFAVDDNTGSQFGNGPYSQNMFTSGNNNIGFSTNAILRVIISRTGKTTFRDSVEVKQTPASTSTNDSIAVLDATTKLIRTIAQPLTGSATLDFPLTVNQASADLTITVTGAVMGDVVALGVPPGSADADSCYTAWVSGANTVTVRFNNYSAGVIDPVSNTFKVKVLR